MNTVIINRSITRHRRAVFAALASVFVAGGAVPPLAADDTARDLTVEQTAIFTVQAPAPTAAVSSGALRVVAWVDHADNTYAVGEAVGLFVRSNKDAYLTVLNVGPSGNTTLLYPERCAEGIAGGCESGGGDTGARHWGQHTGKRTGGGASSSR